jgi:hypothetical protein
MTSWRLRVELAACKAVPFRVFPFDSGRGLDCHPLWISQAGVGCPAAAHNGGEPGSTPGPATREPHYVHLGQKAQGAHEL